MKTIVLLLLLALLTACASPTAVIDQRSFRCGPGQDIEIRAGIFDPTTTREGAGPLTYIVEIANNSHNDVTVQTIRLRPLSDELSILKPVTRTVDQLIPEGEDHVFELAASDVWLRSPDLDPVFARRRLEFEATVLLTNGDSYRCAFAMTARK